MPPTYFKFTTSAGFNRRLTFSHPPTWSLLASKLHGLYGISPDNVGVSYVDNENDEITVSSEEELQDFYNMSHKAGEVIKFAVVDLRSSRNNPGKPLEFPSLNRNPFDGDPFEFVGEWERFPSVLVAEEDRFKSSPHAFVEVLSSNDSLAHEQTHDIDSDDTQDDHSTVQPPLLDKGKGRALSFGAASIISVLGEEMSQKHPIHVYDLNSRKDDKGKDDNFENASVHIHVAPQSTPKVQVKNIDHNRDTEGAPAPSKADEVEDPPLPTLDESPASATSASLFHDLASLVHDVTQVVSSHPELSEGLRNIGRNIGNGTYWATHREALSQAVNGMSNSHEERRQAEEAAARRLTDVVGSFFRTMSQVPVDTESTRVPNISENRSDQSRGENLTPVPPPWHPMNNAFVCGSQGMRANGPFGPIPGPLRGSDHDNFSPCVPFPPRGPHAPGDRLHIRPMPPAYGAHAHNGRPMPARPSSFPLGHALHQVPPPPPPPPPFHAPSAPPPSHHASASTYDHPSPAPPAPETARSVQGHIPPPLPSIPPINGSPGFMHSSETVNDRRQSHQGHQLRNQSARPNTQDLRAQVEAAKRVYKAEKERYRQEREQRRQEKVARRPTAQHGAAAPVEGREISPTHIQNMHPEVEEVEKVGVLRRSHTHLGHGPFRHLPQKPEDSTIVRIAQKLSDMGFSEKTYPALPEKIKAQMPLNGAMSKEAEDEVVTTVLEELLATASPGPNLASGSGQRDMMDVADAWRL